jgi:general secretion pathway protein A
MTTPASTRLKALYGLKFNPFGQDVPDDALLLTPRVDDFGWRLEHGIAAEGGFGLVAGGVGSGKSTTLRLLFSRLERQRDVTVAHLQRPQSSVADFYREMGELFGVPLKPHNRWAGFRSLRDKWMAHIESTLARPMLLIDEAQEMHHQVLAELRLLTQTRFDSRSILGVVLAGDERLIARLSSPELLPLASRIRSRLSLDVATPADLRACLVHRMSCAGNAKLMTDELLEALSEHALGNHRALMVMADELLAHATRHERERLDEKLYFEVFSPPAAAPAKPSKRKSAGRRGR